MRTFIVEILQDGVWQEAKSVFPFTSGELLDERLDEGNISFYSFAEKYKPTTEVRISFFVDGEPDNDDRGSNTEYYIIANDNAVEYPAGSGRYKHETYIIERMKLTEGILCPSITFTNSLPLASNPIGNRVYASVSANSGAPMPLQSYGGVGAFYSPMPNDIPLVLPSINEQGRALAKAIEDNNPIAVGLYRAEARLTIFINGAEFEEISNPDTVYTIAEDEIAGASYIEIQYYLPMTNTNTLSSAGLYFVKFDIDITDSVGLRPYSITDCVLRVLELSAPLMRGENPRFTFDGVTYTNGVAGAYAEGSQAAKYDKIRAPEFTLTQSTLREQLRAIGSYIHAEPYIDENNVVYFLEYGQTKEFNIGKAYVSNAVRWDINQYCTEICSNAQNLTSSLGFAKGTKVEPAPQLYRSLRSEMQYARITEDNTKPDTDEGVYEVAEVLCGLADSEDANVLGWASVGGVLLTPKPITKFVVEKTEYDSNLATDGYYPFAKPWAIYYTQGERGLDGLFYRPPASLGVVTQPFAIANILAAVNGVEPEAVQSVLTDWKFGFGTPSSEAPPCNLVFQITYKPISSAFISHGKQRYFPDDTPYTLVYNQSDNLVESEYYGENMKGVAARLGNVEAERTFLLPRRSYIPRVGYMLDGYAISAVACEYMPMYIKCTVGLTKDFQRISEYVGINSLKRMYEVSERQSQERIILIKNTLLITSDLDATSDTGALFHSPSGFIAAVNPPGEAYTGIDRVSYATFRTYKKNGTTSNTTTLWLPTTARSFGNSVHFAFRCKDNFSAGSTTAWQNEGDVSGRWQNEVRYTDYYGRAYWAAIALSRKPTITGANVAKVVAENAFTLPLLTNGIATNVSDYIAYTPTYHRLRKDNREAIAYNIEVEYKTDVEGLVIGSALAGRCRYVNDYDLTTCRVYCTNKALTKFERYFRFENATDRLIDDAGALTVSVENGTLTLLLPSAASSFTSWVICTAITSEEKNYIDEDGNIVTETETSGGEILLSGSVSDMQTVAPTNKRQLQLKFVIKK